MTAIQKAAGKRTHSHARSRPALSVILGRRTAHEDPRWPYVAAALANLRASKRHSVRIVDADCSGGALLIEAVRYARNLGFTAIEGHGIDGSPLLVGRARAARARLVDPAIGLDFELAEMTQALAREADFPADIVLCHETLALSRSGVATALAAAGNLVIGDPLPASSAKSAA